jgi:uncharacterized protein YjiS (DUF1127 family)
MRDDDFVEDDEILDDATDTNVVTEVPTKPSKAWRSIERYREMKELRQHLDDLLFEGNPEDLKDLHW